MKFAYEIQDKTAIIRRCFGYGDEIEIPGSLEGYPVTELAPYIFSEHFREEELKEGIEAGQVFSLGKAAIGLCAAPACEGYICRRRFKK